MTRAWQGQFEKIDDYRWRIPKSHKSGMRVDGVVYANAALLESLRGDQSPEQVANVACLPGIVGSSLAMPDIHWGYGFCIGGVAATDPQAGGVISPGGVGYDINCGVRLVRTDLPADDVQRRIGELVDKLFATVPCGVGRSGPFKFNRRQMEPLLRDGAAWVVKQGFGSPEDLEATESGGRIKGADPDSVSDRAYERGKDQCGTLGSGNHFIEVQVIDEVFDEQAASVLGLAEGGISVMIHSGSRGLGHQVCEDAIKQLRNAPQKYGIDLPDRQLVCAPVDSPEGRRYLGAMGAAANFAWANRQLLMNLVRKAFAEFFGRPAERLGMTLVYDVAHNIAKTESYEVQGSQRELCVHRKGATRAFPPGHPEVPAKYRAIGQPVGLPGAMSETFGSTCHGAGRVLSRSAAIRAAKGRSIKRELADAGVVARARGRTGLDEEQPAAYKDVSEVVAVVEGAGISKRICRLKPIGVIKG